MLSSSGNKTSPNLSKREPDKAAGYSSESDDDFYDADDGTENEQEKVAPKDVEING